MFHPWADNNFYDVFRKYTQPASINGVIAVSNIKGLVNGTSAGADSNNNRIIIQPFFTN